MAACGPLVEAALDTGSNELVRQNCGDIAQERVRRIILFLSPLVSYFHLKEVKRYHNEEDTSKLSLYIFPDISSSNGRVLLREGVYHQVNVVFLYLIQHRYIYITIGSPTLDPTLISNVAATGNL
jgi:hypothetical protein